MLETIDVQIAYVTAEVGHIEALANYKIALPCRFWKEPWGQTGKGGLEINGKKIYTRAGVLLLIAMIGFMGNNFLPGKKELNDSWQTALVSRRNVGSVVLATRIIKPMTGAEVKVGSRISDIVQPLYVNIRDVVEKGQILAELESTELQESIIKSG